MENWQHIAALARQAADLLPGPPPADDREGYQAWESLVLSAAARIGVLAGASGAVPATLGSRARHRLDWRALLGLASVELPEGALHLGS
ncbi:hypothetical protein [Prauserella cavernicola]|uniref:Uncharacterized protein n=1 Tax=Prauserella cavernicola TaxID=2800127 RepID=A0A934QX19_9PSEU|nr:hypothetical protein [Prauserella cavernicola]MBK1787114.1 hypothetical protein [Prauserella cavernicola]